jgi:parallel beta-helix repeat protein
VTRTTIRDSTVTGAGSSGVYLEAGSADNVVTRNRILDNGFRENGPGGSRFTFSGITFRFWGTGREGISVDGSRRNLITANTLRGNSAGGIFLYTNCGEFVRSRPERWFERRYGADDNVIALNRLQGGVNGVWVGSRMGESTLPMECSDVPYVSSACARPRSTARPATRSWATASARRTPPTTRS